VAGQLDQIIAAVEPLLGPCDGEPVPLEGGITNRNFRARLGGNDYVVRVHGANTGLLGIDRNSERLAVAAAAQLGIGPELIAAPPGGLVTRFVPCASLSAAEVAARIEEVAAALRRFHDAGPSLPSAFSVPALLAGYAEIVTARGRPLPDVYAETLTLAERVAGAMPAGERRPCHNDLLAGNIIHATADERIMLVDWEYAGMGDPYFDLGNLAVNNELDGGAEERLLQAYLGRAPADGERAALKLGRILSDAREAGWGVVQAAVSELEFDFAGYGGEHFERLWRAVRRPDFEELLATT
jgi:thiamine kinase-like enzyme